MARVTEKVSIPMDPDLLWENIGGFGAVGIWHPMLEKVDVQREELGAVRTAHGRDGSTHVERLMDMEPEQHRYRYKWSRHPSRWEITSVNSGSRAMPSMRVRWYGRPTSR